MPASATLPRRVRLRTPRDFRRAYSRGRRMTGKLIVVVALPRREAGLRLGVSVSKEHGAAVRRNKIKRLLREAFRLERAALPHALDVILIPKTPGVRYALAELRADLRQLVERIARGEGRARREDSGRP